MQSWVLTAPVTPLPPNLGMWAIGIHSAVDCGSGKARWGQPPRWWLSFLVGIPTHVGCESFGFRRNLQLDKETYWIESEKYCGVVTHSHVLHDIAERSVRVK